MRCDNKMGVAYFNRVRCGYYYLPRQSPTLLLASRGLMLIDRVVQRLIVGSPVAGLTHARAWCVLQILGIWQMHFTAKGCSWPNMQYEVPARRMKSMTDLRQRTSSDGDADML